MTSTTFVPEPLGIVSPIRHDAMRCVCVSAGFVVRATRGKRTCKVKTARDGHHPRTHGDFVTLRQ